MTGRQDLNTLLPQGVWDFQTILEPHFGNLAYKVVEQQDTANQSQEYSDEAALWRDLQRGQLRERTTVVLKGFRLFDYVPRAPGLFHSPNAEWARQEAFQYLDDRLGDSPAQIDAAADADHRVVFAPMGKQSMLDGGVGCVRLKPIVVDDRVYLLMSATSGDEAHTGIPVAMPEQLFDELISHIYADGAVVCDIQGQFAGLPPELVDLFGNSIGYPRLYLRVDKIQTRTDVSPPNSPQVSVAVSFTSDYERRNGIYASYVTFTPGDNSSFDDAITWLNDVYVEGGYAGKIITDFDQTRSWFPGSALSLRSVMNRTRNELSQDVLELMHARGLVDDLFDALEREDLVSKLGSRVRNRAFISYSHKDLAMLEEFRAQLRTVPDTDLHVWDDRRIKPGTRWRNSILREIGTAKVALLLVSQDFLDSSFIQEAELPKLLEDEEREGIKVLTLFLEECNVASVPHLEKVQGINSPGMPLSKLGITERSEVLKSAAKEVHSVLHGL